MTDPVRVTFVISGLVVGGAERILTAIANGWAGAGWHVSILTLDGPDQPPFFPVDPLVDVRRLDLAGVSRGRVDAIRNNVRRLARLRRAVASTRPDVVISFMDRTNVLTLLATIGTQVPVIVSDRTSADPGSHGIWHILRRIAYRRARWIVVQTAGAARAMPASLRRQTVTIPNPVLTPVADPVGRPASPVKLRPSRRTHHVVALGRLVPQKGFDLLIEAFATVVERVPTARLSIWGEGPERAMLTDLIAQRNLRDVVALEGETRMPAAAIEAADVFVLSSRIEGFPNVLIEAMAAGRPVVAVDCRFGPAEIIEPGDNGLLVPAGDGSALADAIVELLTKPDLAGALGANARSVRGRFAFEAILERWTDLVVRPDGVPTP